MAVNIQMANTSFEIFNASDPSIDGKKASSAFENAFSVFRRNSKTEKEDENAKKTLFGKILKILSLKVSESKNAEKSRKFSRQRRRSSATPSNFEPMPTIYEEENESEFFDLTSFNPIPSSQTIIAVA